MIEYTLFLGFAVDPLFLQQLEKQDQAVVNTFLDSKGLYLQKVTFQKMTFFGKVIGDFIPLESLESLEKNVFSLLKKIVPDFPYQETPLYLFALATNE